MAITETLPTTLRPGMVRSLTEPERLALSPGLTAALQRAGAFPRIAAGASPLARVAALWRGETPFLTLGDVIHWPAAPADASRRAADMALLQHELHHVLDFATGALTWWSYGLDPRNWIYRLPERIVWRHLGAEQRAMVAERLWWAEAAGDAAMIALCRRHLPWPPIPWSPERA
jgi:hypothetical protein